MRRILLIIIVTVGAMWFIHSSPDQGTEDEFHDSGIRVAPLNPAFIKYMEQLRPGVRPPTVEGRRVSGWVPPPLDLAQVEGTLDEAVDTTTYPAYYDLRDQPGKLPPVQDQDGYPACWSFAAYCSLESCLLPEESKDFSEWHLYSNHGFDRPEGGNAEITTAYLARWDGPVDESAAPYGSGSVENDQLVTAKHVQQVMFLPRRKNPLDNNTTKWFVMNYGALYAGIRYDRDSFSETFASHYYRFQDDINHGVAILGWDDNYPASRFLTPPPGNGAFIARNSWGSGWADGGHFYISYYDTAVTPKACFNNAEEVTNYGTIYQYDPYGAVSAVGGTGSGPATIYWGANIFTTVNDQPIEAVSFYITDAHVKCDIYVYKNTSPHSPVDGTLAAQKSASFIYPGYYTVRLDEPIFLNRGQRFSVAIRFDTTDFPFPVPIETPVNGYITSTQANAGESFVSADGLQWKDLTLRRPDSNVCIKAMARTIESHISLTARRETVSSWLADIDYGVLTFAVENLQEVPVSKLLIYRKEGDGTYLLIDEVDEAGGADFSLVTYTDRNRLRRDRQYTYQVAAVNLVDIICGMSDGQTI